jgi:hypothetical protein
MTLSDLSDTCDTCDERATFTGRTQLREGRMYAILKCPSCHADIPVWSKENEALVREWAASPLPEAAMLPLRGKDPAAIAAYLAHPPQRVPCWGLRDVAVEPGAAGEFATMMLNHPGLFPRPGAPDRLAEALTAALWFDDAACASLAAERIATISGAEAEGVLLKLQARAADRSGAALRPFIAALRGAGGDYAVAVGVAERRWALPRLREALSP